MEQEIFQRIIKIAQLAGEEILKVYHSEDFGVETKTDDSPLTEADRRAHELISEQLDLEFPEIPILSEESKGITYEDRSHWDTFWLVDPLDGTKEFIKKNGEFTVNIALIQNGQPIAGVVYQPTENLTYYREPNGASYRLDKENQLQPLQASESYNNKQLVKVVASRSHMSEAVTEFCQNLERQGKEVSFLSAGSSLKLCYVAEGKADVYPRLGPTMEWDTAAAQAVVEGAGSEVLNWETKKPLTYNKEDLLNPWFIVQ